MASNIPIACYCGAPATWCYAMATVPGEAIGICAEHATVWRSFRRSLAGTLAEIVYRDHDSVFVADKGARSDDDSP